ncbi:MAG: hypothetical protein C4317_01605, partial [Acidimicrobiia bacterium]
MFETAPIEPKSGSITNSTNFSRTAAESARKEIPFPLPITRPLPQPDTVLVRRRILETFSVIRRRFGSILKKRVLRQRTTTEEVARALRLSFEDLGATYLKFGQLIASSPGIFGEAISQEFRTCLDTGPAIPFWKVRKIVERELGAPLEEIYDEFDSEPIAAASIAAVHRGRLTTGDEVAVKVVRPGVASTIATDIEIMEPLFSLLAKQIGVGLAGPLLQLLSGFSRQVAEELNLENELRVMDYNRQLARALGLKKILVPKTYPELS